LQIEQGDTLHCCSTATAIQVQHGYRGLQVHQVTRYTVAGAAQLQVNKASLLHGKHEKTRLTNEYRPKTRLSGIKKRLIMPIIENLMRLEPA
jgi:hypothetical protein